MSQANENGTQYFSKDMLIGGSMPDGLNTLFGGEAQEKTQVLKRAKRA